MRLSECAQQHIHIVWRYFKTERYDLPKSKRAAVYKFKFYLITKIVHQTTPDILTPQLFLNREHIIVVSDDGVGFDMEKTDELVESDRHAHVGLINLRERLNLMCDGYIVIKSSPEAGTTATVHIPEGEEHLHSFDEGTNRGFSEDLFQ